MDLNMFFTTLAASGVASAAFVFLAKILSNHLLSMDLERFKAQLKADNETALERLRADLRITAFQQETTFAKLHTKRAEVIAELYRQLVAVDVALKVLISGSAAGAGVGKQQERENQATNTAIAFSRYYNENRIYFERDLCNQIDKLNNQFLNAFVTHMLPTLGKDSSQHLQNYIPQIRGEIEDSFRKLLGLTPSSITSSKTY